MASQSLAKKILLNLGTWAMLQKYNGNCCRNIYGGMQYPFFV